MEQTERSENGSRFCDLDGQRKELLQQNEMTALIPSLSITRNTPAEGQGFPECLEAGNARFGKPFDAAVPLPFSLAQRANSQINPLSTHWRFS